MARFGADYEETFTAEAPADRVVRHLGDLDAIARNYGQLERWEKVDAETLRLVLVPKSDRGISFQGRYTCRYRIEGRTLRWETIGQDNNLWSSGTAVVTELGPNRCTVAYRQRMDAEIPIPSLLGKIVAPIVNHEIRTGVRDYLGRMRGSIPAG